MYSNKESINILTSLLVSHGVRHAIVCPGSRNAPIVHNLNECPDIECYPVTDERSAGFYALGMAQATRQSVVVCVTSGTALLNLAPAVAEAYYQHLPVVVISADRPPQWIDQLDGQTLPQPDALGRFVRRAVSLPEIREGKGKGVQGCDEERWYCNRLVNEALMERHAPVHINVPISEPLFQFSVPELPVERKIEYVEADMSPQTLNHIVHSFMQAKRPMLISGQPMNPLMDEAVAMIQDDEHYAPDFVLYTGDSIVSKRLKRFLRRAKETWAVNRTGEVNDTFMNLTHVVQGDGEIVADMVRFHLEQQPHPFVQLWDDLLQRIRQHVNSFEPAYSQMAAVKYFEQQLQHASSNPYHPTPTIHHPSPNIVHYANSMPIRLANIYAQHTVCCNRGVNGIEGTLSTAAGFSLILSNAQSPIPNTYCVLGDLSFFYDQNALWNQNLHSNPSVGRLHSSNLRILLVNNGRGGIFNQLKGLDQSPARDRFVAATHDTTAEGICHQCNVDYRRATDMDSMRQGIDWLMHTESEHPLLLEVFTDADADSNEYRKFFNEL